MNLVGATIDGGLLRTFGTGQFVPTSGTILDSTTNQVTVDGTVNVINNQALNVVGDLINKQDINLLATSLSSSLLINSSVDLTGGGTVNMSNDAGNRITGVSGGFLNNVDHLIRGSGTIGISNTLGVRNQHLIEADQSVPLTIIGGPGFENDGTLRAKNGAALNLTGGIFDNQTGLIVAENTSTVNLQSVTIEGGLLQTVGSGAFNAAATLLDGSTNKVTLDGTMNVANNQTLTVQGDFDNKNNTINLNATSLSSNLRFNGTVNLAGGGTVQMSNDAGNRLIGQAGGYMINHDNLITGSGVIGTSGTLQVLNHSVIQSNQSAGMTLVGTAGFENRGILRADGALLVFEGGTFDNALGEINGINGATIHLASTTIEGGQLNADGSSIITAVNSTLDGTFSAVILDGTLSMANNQTITVEGDLTNKSNSILLNATSLSSNLRILGNVNLDGGGSILMSNDAGNRIIGAGGGHLVNEDNLIQGSGSLGLNTLTMTNRGIIDANQTVGMALDPATGGFLNDTSGIIRVSGSGGMTFAAGGHTNRGTIELDPTRVLAISASGNFVNESGLVSIGDSAGVFVTGTYTQDGGTTDLHGTLSSTVLNDFNGGVLSGNGDVIGTSDFAAASTIAAGDSPGIINFLDDLAMAGTFAIELEGNLVEGLAQNIGQVNTGSDPGLIGFDQVNVYDTVTLADGTIFELERIGGYNPNVGDFFDVLTGDDIIMLGSISVQTDSPGLVFATSIENLFDATTGTNRDVLRFTTVSSVPEPGPTAILALVMLIGFSLMLRRDRALYAKA